MSAQTKKTCSDVFQIGSELKWEDAEPGVQRQVMGYDGQLMVVKVKFEKGAVGKAHSHYHTQATYVAKGKFEVTIGDKTQVLKEGDGRKGELGLLVEFDYKGTFTNGQIFDQTYGNRPPIVHMIDEGLMPGLREAFCMMKAGSKYRFYFPSEMAFGAQGSEDIPPFTTVIYEVELHDVHE
jgi:FKBP-type peptidyl-prolyl cis-trans isomerase